MTDNTHPLAARAQQALTDNHPQPLTATELAEDLDVDTATVRAALAELEAAGVATPSTPNDDALWTLHGPTRDAANLDHRLCHGPVHIHMTTDPTPHTPS